MFSKQSREFLERDEKIKRRLELWNSAVHIVKTMAAVHSGPGFEDCGWRGDHRDVAAVADYLDTMNPETLGEQVAEAGNWINSERYDSNGLKERGRPIVHELLNHLRKKFS